jgi:tripartite-type tricarboxylate transporter receptor subunit TctC
MTIEWSGVHRVRKAAVVFTAAIALGCSVAAGQNYPTKTVKIIVPFPGGGPLDFTARLLAEKLSARLRQPFIIENRPGAAGNIGAEAVARAEPDGSTLLFVLDTTLTVSPTLYDKLSFDPERDFSPVSIAAGFSTMLVVHPSVPVKSLPELVAYAKQRPLTYGSGGGSGNPGHLTMEYLRMRAGFPATHVPYRGNAQVVTDLVGGQVQAGFVATPGVLLHVRDGRLNALAVSTARRTAGAAQVPPAAESGCPGFDVEFYLVMLAPAGVPESIRALLEREVRDALQSPDIQARLRAQELEPIASTGAEAKVRLKAIAERWRDLIRAAHIKPD